MGVDAVDQLATPAVRRHVWTIAFLGVTALALVMECLAAFDRSPDTLPWTYLITHFIPSYVFWPVLTGLVGWIVYHFVEKYRQVKRERDEARAAHAATTALLADTVVKATEYGVQDGGFVANYILPTGPIHRAIPALQEQGITVRPGFDGRSASDSEAPTPIPKDA